MEINNNKLNSLPQQVEENMKNIQLLAQYLKEAYHTNDGVELNHNSISVAKSLTNADSSVNDGWLLDSIGSLFKITGGDDSSLLIEFYTSFRGIQGIQGETGLQGSDGLSIHYTSDVYDDNVDTYLLANIQALVNVKANDIVVFKNGYIAKITNVSETDFTIDNNSEIKLEVNKPLYTHNISMKNHLDNTANATNIRVFITILNDNPNEYDLTTLIDYLYNNGYIVNNLSYKDRNDFKQCSGGYTYSDAVQFTCGGIACDTGKTGFYFNVGTMGRVEYAASSSFVTSPNVTFKDTIKQV